MEKMHAVDLGEGRSLEIVMGDITHQQVDAIANAANSRLAGGGGVDGAIHKAAGPKLMEYCREMGGCKTGSAVSTPAGNLSAKYVFHAVGPVYKGGQKGEAELLKSAYTRCMELGDEHSIESIAFPSISTGVYGYPIDEASVIAIETTKSMLESSETIKVVKFVLFGDEAYDAFYLALSNI